MIGEPRFPGDVTEKVSVVQSPMAPPFSTFAAAVTTVPATGPPMLKVCQKESV